MSFTDLGKATGLSTSAVHQRVKRLEQRGLILGYGATVNHDELGLPLTAFISIRPIDPSQPDDSPTRLEEHPRDRVVLVGRRRRVLHPQGPAGPAQRPRGPARPDPRRGQRLDPHHHRALDVLREPPRHRRVTGRSLATGPGLSTALRPGARGTRRRRCRRTNSTFTCASVEPRSSQQDVVESQRVRVRAGRHGRDRLDGQTLVVAVGRCRRVPTDALDRRGPVGRRRRRCSRSASRSHRCDAPAVALTKPSAGRSEGHAGDRVDGQPSACAERCPSGPAVS